MHCGPSQHFGAARYAQTRHTQRVHEFLYSLELVYVCSEVTTAQQSGTSPSTMRSGKPSRGGRRWQDVLRWKSIWSYKSLLVLSLIEMPRCLIYRSEYKASRMDLALRFTLPCGPLRFELVHQVHLASTAIQASRRQFVLGILHALGVVYAVSPSPLQRKRVSCHDRGCFPCSPGPDRFP